MTWLDALLVILVMAVAALIAERRWTGVLIAAAGIILVGPILRIGQGAPLIGLLLAIAAGLILAILAARVLKAPPERDRTGVIAGSFMGLVFGAVLLLAVLVSLPLGRNNQGQIVYPGMTTTPAVTEALVRSPLVAYGRSVLLQPLLAGQPNSPESSQWAITRLLHDWLVPGEPRHRTRSPPDFHSTQMVPLELRNQ